MSENSAPLLVITGPTGIGKTELAMALSDQAPLALISADSVMVYQDLDIGSAKPSPIELAQYPHALVDIVPLSIHLMRVSLYCMLRRPLQKRGMRE